MNEIEKRIGNIEAIQDINQCLTRYCRALDWSDEDLLKTCFLEDGHIDYGCLLYTSPSPRDVEESRMPSSA